MISTQPPLCRIGMIARWRPPHLGHTPILNALCQRAEHAFIGIGSSNRYDLRNPFTLDETLDMLRLVLAAHNNYTLIPVPDLGHGPRWRAMVKDMFGPLDQFVTDNPYVANLMAADYAVIKPVTLIPPEQRIAIDGTLVRRHMARGDDWRDLVPPNVADYIITHHLDQRFRREFGLQTLTSVLVTE